MNEMLLVDSQEMPGKDESKTQNKTVEMILTEGLGGQLPEAVFIASGGIKKDPEAARLDGMGYKSLTYAEGDYDTHGMVTGGKARVSAGAYIGRSFPEIRLVTTSRVEEDTPSHAAVMAAELKRRGIPEDQIILEEQSNNTVSELMEMVKIAIANNWTRLGFITSDYHVPRVQALFDHLEEIVGDQDEEFLQFFKKFKDRQIEVEFINAEEVLESANPRYQSVFAKARATEAYQQRLDAEAQGISHIKEGHYRWQKKQ